MFGVLYENQYLRFDAMMNKQSQNSEARSSNSDTKPEKSTNQSQGSFKLSIPKEKMCKFKNRICRRPCVKSFDYCELHVQIIPPEMSNESKSGFARCSFVAPRTATQCWNPSIMTPGNGDKGNWPRQFCRQHRIKVHFTKDSIVK